MKCPWCKSYGGLQNLSSFPRFTYRHLQQFIAFRHAFKFSIEGRVKENFNRRYTPSYVVRGRFATIIPLGQISLLGYPILTYSFFISQMHNMYVLGKLPSQIDRPRPVYLEFAAGAFGGLSIWGGLFIWIFAESAAGGLSIWGACVERGPVYLEVKILRFPLRKPPKFSPAAPQKSFQIDRRTCLFGYLRKSVWGGLSICGGLCIWIFAADPLGGLFIWGGCLFGGVCLFGGGGYPKWTNILYISLPFFFLSRLSTKGKDFQKYFSFKSLPNSWKTMLICVFEQKNIFISYINVVNYILVKECEIEEKRGKEKKGKKNIDLQKEI